MGTNLCKLDEENTIVAIENTKFSSGQYKHAYRGVDQTSMKRVVVKLYAEKWRSHQDIVKDLEAHRIAHKLARKFNSLKLPGAPKIEFLVPKRAHVTSSRPCSGIQVGEAITVEPELSGARYEKYISNNGTFAPDHIALAIFVHWTYHETKGNRMVVDLQGVKIKKGYILTDPAVHSRRGSFGDLDLASIGMQSFFANHRCTETCRNFRRPERIDFDVGACEKIMQSRLTRAKSSSTIVPSSGRGASRYQ